MPLQRYVATVTLKPVTDGDRTFWHWESTFATPPGRERELARDGRARRLRSRLREPAPPPARRRRPAPARARAAAERAAAADTPRRGPSRYGGAEVLQADDGEAAAPGAGEVRIRQRAIGVNYIDVYLRKGWIPAMLPLPGVPGMEAAGTVVDVGANVNGMLPGDRVAYLGPAAGRVLQRAHGACRLGRPAAGAVEDDVAAASLLKGITADLPVRDLGHVGAGTRLLVHAAAGGVGLPRLRLGAPPRRDRHRHRLERGEGAARARVRLRAPDRDARPSLRRRGPGAVRRRRRARRRHRRRRARRELRRARAPRPLDQPRPGERRAARRSTADRLVQKSITLLAPRGVRLRRGTRAWPSARAASGRRSPTAR